MADEIPTIPLPEYLRLREEQLWRELLAIAPEKIRELQGILQSKRYSEQGSVPVHPGPYSHLKNATDAILLHLRAVPNFTLSREMLERAVLDGGWGLFIQRRSLNVRDAIRFRIKSGEILETDGLLGLPQASE